MVSESEPTTYMRMDTTGRNFVRLRFTHDKVTRSHIVDGAVVEERDVTAEYVKQNGGWMKREEQAGG